MVLVNMLVRPFEMLHLTSSIILCLALRGPPIAMNGSNFIMEGNRLFFLDSASNMPL